MKEDFNKYIDEHIIKLDMEITTLKNSDRSDEANLTKIKINIFNIAKAIFENSFSKIKDNNSEALLNDFVYHFTQIRDTWRISYDKATVNGDTTKAVIEEIKIQTADDILADWVRSLT